MPAAHLDTGTTYPVLVAGRSEVRQVQVTSSTGTPQAIADGGTVTLYDVAGTSRGTGTTSGGGVTYTVSSSCPDGPAVEVWSVTAGGVAYTFRVGVLVGKADLPCPISDDALEQQIAALGTYPDGETTWAKWRNRGWDRVIRDLVRRQGTASLWDPAAVYDAALASCMAVVLRTAAGYGAQPWADLAAEWERRYQHEIDRVILRLDTDSDQAPDTDPLRQSTGVAIGERPTVVG